MQQNDTSKILHRKSDSELNISTIKWCIRTINIPVYHCFLNYICRLEAVLKSVLCKGIFCMFFSEILLLVNTTPRMFSSTTNLLNYENIFLSTEFSFDGVSISNWFHLILVIQAFLKCIFLCLTHCLCYFIIWFWEICKQQI